MQNDFVTGALGSAAAAEIIAPVKAKIANYRQAGQPVIFTRDSHTSDYLNTQEGRLLPVEHCIINTAGHEIIAELDPADSYILDKPAFGSLELAEYIAIQHPAADLIELCGLCSDICVVSNALILKAKFPETVIAVDCNCCAGVNAASHQAALLTMKMCHVQLLGHELH